MLLGLSAVRDDSGARHETGSSPASIRRHHSASAKARRKTWRVAGQFVLGTVAITIFLSLGANAQTFKKAPGGGTEIAVGGGQVWLIGTNPVAPGKEDHEVYQWNGSNWDLKHNAGGERIAVDAQGSPWLINSKGQVWRYNGSTFYQGPGGGRDIGAGGGQVWLIGTNPSDETSPKGTSTEMNGDGSSSVSPRPSPIVS